MESEQEHILVDHKVILKTFSNHINMEISVNTLLLEVIEEWYLHKLQNDTLYNLE